MIFPLGKITGGKTRISKNFPERGKSRPSLSQLGYFFPNGKMTETRIEIPEDLGRLIRERRREVGLNQTQLADVARTTLRFISELEGGKPTAQLDGILRVLAALGIELEARTR